MFGRLLISQILGAVALLVTHPLAIIALSFWLRSSLGFLCRRGNSVAALLGVTLIAFPAFLEKEFLSTKLSGRKIELDEVVEPLLQPDGGARQKEVSVEATPFEQEANHDDHETSDQVAIGPRRSTRACTAPEWYGNPVLSIILLDNNEPTSYGEAMVGLNSDKWLEAMKSERGSIYENGVYALEELLDGRKTVKYRWIF